MLRTWNYKGRKVATDPHLLLVLVLALPLNKVCWLVSSIDALAPWAVTGEARVLTGSCFDDLWLFSAPG